MTAESSSGTSFKGWILGILGAVITAVLIFWAEQQLTQKPAPPLPSHTFVSINGRVIDRAANRLLQNALVELSGKSLKEEQSTDSEGRYAFTLEDFDPRMSGSMMIQAAGYKPLTLNLSLQEMSAIQDQFLDAQPPAPPTGVVAAPNTAAAPSKGALVGKYMVRPDIKRVSTFLKHP
jgi:hypothetical protein